MAFSGNALFNSICNMVVTETDRPDLVPETVQAVQEATLFFHCSDFYFKDIVQAQASFATADYIQTLDTTTVNRFRNIAFFKKAVPGPTLYQPMSGSIQDPPIPDPVSGSFSFPLNQYVFLTEVDDDFLLDDYGYEKIDIFYQAGTTINIKSSTPIVNGQFGWYAFPSIDSTGSLDVTQIYNSWIAQQFPFAIVYKAAATVFKKIGQDAATSAYNDPNTGLYAEQLALLKMMNIRATGK